MQLQSVSPEIHTDFLIRQSVSFLWPPTLKLGMRGRLKTLKKLLLMWIKLYDDHINQSENDSDSQWEFVLKTILCSIRFL